MIFLRTICALLVVLLIGADAAAGQVRDTTRTDTTIFRIGEIVVQAARPVATVGGASAIEVRLDSLAMPAAPTLEGVLREIPFVHVRTNSRGEAEITMRGSESRTVAVLVDGVPLTLGWDARTDVSVVPATAPQELTLIRGLSSVLYGPNTLGGIVEVGVGRGATRGTRSLQFTAGVDHLGGYSTSVGITAPVETYSGRWLVRAGGGYRNLPGVPLADDVIEPIPTDDGLRLNTDVDHKDGFAAVRYTADGGAWFSASGSGFSAERGIAAELGSSDPRLWRYPDLWRVVAVGSGGTGDRETPFGRGDIEASFGVDVGRTEIESFATRDYQNVIGTEDGDDRTYTLRLLADHTVGSRADLRTAFTYADISHDEVLDDGPVNEYRQRLWSFGAESVVRLIERGQGTFQNLRLSFGGVVDRGDTPESSDKPPLGTLTDWGARVGLTAAVADGDALLHAGVSRRVRFPALRELYSGALNRFEPNPDLTPERLVAAEAGITARIGAGELQAVGFHHRLNDAIVRITLPNRLLKRVNRDQMRSTGLELLGSYAFGPVSVGGDLMLQHVELIDPEQDETREPENQPFVTGSLNARFPLPLEVQGIAEARYTGSQFCLDFDTGADRRLDAGTRFNAEAARTFMLRSAGSPWISRLEARVAVDNIADEAIYDQCGLPQPGRLLRFQIRLF
jgi:iron complex outermembrane receptor protein